MALLPGGFFGGMNLPQSANPLPPTPGALLGAGGGGASPWQNPMTYMMLANILGGARQGPAGVAQAGMDTMGFFQDIENQAQLNKQRQRQLELQEKEEERQQKKFEFDVEAEQTELAREQQAREKALEFARTFNGGMGTREDGQQQAMSPAQFMANLTQVPGMEQQALKNLAQLKMEQATNRPQTFYQGGMARQMMIDPMSGEESLVGMGPRFSLQAMMPPGLRAEQERAGKAYGGMFESYLESGSQGRDMLGKVNRYERLLENVDTGAFATPRKAISQTLEFLGLDPGRLGIGELGPAEAAEALKTQIATAFVGDTKGAISDSEMNLFLQSAGGLATSKAGNKLIAETLRRIAERKIRVSNMAEQYRAKRGTIQGFGEYLDQWSRENPLFDEQMLSKIEKASQGRAQQGGYFGGAGVQQPAQSDLSNISDEELMRMLQESGL